MTSLWILARFRTFQQTVAAVTLAQPPQPPPAPWANRFALRQDPHAWPAFAQTCPIALRYHTLLAPLAWDRFPERDLNPRWTVAAVPYAPFLAACLVKLDQKLVSMGALRRFLLEHPALVWLLGFPLTPDVQTPHGFDANASLPTERHLTQMLRDVPATLTDFLLDATIQLLLTEFRQQGLRPGEVVAFDTKHIVAWVKENNPKAYVRDRFNKDHQPAGDPDCRLGCKRRRNVAPPLDQPPATPLHNGQPPRGRPIGEFYWGYGSGLVTVRMPGPFAPADAAPPTEFVLAELTLPFDRPDVAYFDPLMQAAERRLGFRPTFGAADAAFDAFYVYEYFHQAGGFAAVPFVDRRGERKQFSPDGLPLCSAGRAMPLRYTFANRSTFRPHDCGRYVCPLLFPTMTGERCPIRHPQWKKGGCISTLPLGLGPRLRYQLDRDGEAFKQIYATRTAAERLNSQAVALGIERPRLRNGDAIARLNTLIYTLINLRAWHRLR